MKLAHVADAHWGMGYAGPKTDSRFEDISRTMDFVADRIIEEKCDGVLFAGDAFKNNKVPIERAAIEIQAFAAWLRKISDAGISVLAISGTPSHDAVSAYELVREFGIPGVTIATRPGIHEIAGVKVGCIPGLNRSEIATREQVRDLTPGEIHGVMSNALTDLSLGLYAQGATVLMAHLTLAGADTGFDELKQEHEPILTLSAIEPFGLVCLGHIHKAQQCGKAFYSGAPERLSFNDEGVPTGFWIHETGRDSRFIDTPARVFTTLSGQGGLLECASAEKPVDGAIVRVKLPCTEEEAAQIDRKAMERMLYESGAFFVSEILLDPEKSKRGRDREVTEELGPVEAVARWGMAREMEEPEIVLLQGMTADLMGEVAS